MATANRHMEFERYPKFKASYIRAFDRMLIRGRSRGNVYYNWECGQDVFDWWMDDSNMDKPIPGQIEWEDIE
jgi:phosphoadenosine phosphosulfate reductase